MSWIDFFGCIPATALGRRWVKRMGFFKAASSLHTHTLPRLIGDGGRPLSIEVGIYFRPVSHSKNCYQVPARPCSSGRVVRIARSRKVRKIYTKRKKEREWRKDFKSIILRTRYGRSDGVDTGCERVRKLIEVRVLNQKNLLGRITHSMEVTLGWHSKTWEGSVSWQSRSDSSA